MKFALERFVTLPCSAVTRGTCDQSIRIVNEVAHLSKAHVRTGMDLINIAVKTFEKLNSHGDMQWNVKVTTLNI